MAQNKPALIGVIAIVLLASAGTVAMIALDKKSATSADSITSQPAASDTTNTTAPKAPSATYKDGTYTATGSYNSPGGTEKIGVTVTLQNGVVTSSSVDTSHSSGDATLYQKQFADSYKGQVVGKNIDAISLSRVSGSSLTSNGFNNALDTIKEQAKA